MEYLSRGVSAVSSGSGVFVSWRLLADDPQDIAFNVYRTTDSKTEKLNSTPLTGGTNFTDTKANLKKNNTYTVKAVIGGQEYDTDDSDTLAANSTANVRIVNIKPGSQIHFVWVGDFNGDGSYDYLVDRNTDEHQKGYFQSHMLDYYLGTGMEMPENTEYFDYSEGCKLGSGF